VAEFEIFVTSIARVMDSQGWMSMNMQGFRMTSIRPSLRRKQVHKRKKLFFTVFLCQNALY